jgi:hypothetical protein
MDVFSNARTFCGKKVVDFDIKKTIRNLEKSVYRLRLHHDKENGRCMEKLLDAFAQTSLATNVQEMIIGLWETDGSSNQLIIHKLVALKETFTQLRALFIGDIQSVETEISWIQQSDVSPLWAAYPDLEHFQVRGGNHLSLGTLNHAHLKTLIIEAGGLPPNVIQEVSNAQLPDLEHLEIWLGSDSYGFDSKIEDFETIINGGKFPKLNYLALKNSIIQDEIAIKIAHSTILDQIEILDLSMGLLSDVGAQALLDSPKVKNLKFLNVERNYMSDKMAKKIKALGTKVKVTGQKTPDDIYGKEFRYVEVSE